MKKIVSVILAAGEGTRMKSSLPKVLHRISGKPMIEYVLDAILRAGCKKNYIIVGHKKEKVEKTLKKKGYNGEVSFVEQTPLLGSGHAVLQTKGVLRRFKGNIIITCGDIPLVTTGTLKALMKFHAGESNCATVLTAVVDDPLGYGRIVLGKAGAVKKIVEEKDASVKQKLIKRINTGIYCFKARELFGALEKVRPNNKKREYYLTDVISIMSAAHLKVGYDEVDDVRETTGVNTVKQLAMAAKYLRQRGGSKKQ